MTTNSDVFENVILCGNCNKKTKKTEIVKDGFRIRTWQCSKCGKKWYHPLDIQEYKNFSKIKNKSFQVKLRMVGNSYTVSIPREIIEFQEGFHKEMQKEMDKMKDRMAKMIHMSLEEPEKLSLFFSKRLKELSDRS